MKRRILNSEATLLIDNRLTGIHQTVTIQVRSAGNVFVATQQNDLQQLDSTGSPVNGLKLSQANSVEDGRFANFIGQLWARSDVGADVDVNIINVDPPRQSRLGRTNTPANAPRWGNT